MSRKIFAITLKHQRPILRDYLFRHGPTMRSEKVLCGRCITNILFNHCLDLISPFLGQQIGTYLRDQGMRELIPNLS